MLASLLVLVGLSVEQTIVDALGRVAGAEEDRRAQTNPGHTRRFRVQPSRSPRAYQSSPSRVAHATDAGARASEAERAGDAR